ncbi:MAG: Fpg/Nei family DNA glycosylase [Chloroflexi bacterium]|nr:Fpg/Nei family DNA glycosylase [Chloroflexota bacterium]
MPEGDTIAQSALTLAGVLVGRRVTGFRSGVPGIEDRATALGVVGSEVLAVESRGKHLLLHFGRKGASPADDDVPNSTNGPAGAGPPASVVAMLRTHMRMTGSWHLYRVGSRWQKPAHYARVVVEAGDVLAVCFSAPEVELLTGGQLSGHAGLARLGPDLLAPDFDEADALARLSASPDLAIADALLDQSIVAGIGNVYKSEVCFLERVNPFQTVGSLPLETLQQMIRTARRQMSRNVGAMQRRTTHGPRRNALWVYDRAGQPCTRCGTLIRRALQGPHARSTYWCPGCQL